MTEQEFSQWGIVFAISAATAALALGIIIFYIMLQDKRAGIPVIVAFALAGIGKAAKFYLLSAISVVLMIPVIAYFSYHHIKKPVVWISWLLLITGASVAFYAYRVLYVH